MRNGLVAILFCLAVSPVWAKTDSLQIKGSDTMVNLSQAWAEAYMDKYPQRLVAVTGGGSGNGIASLISASCDIAMSSRSIKPKEIAAARKKGVEPRELKVALDGIAVVVNPRNPVSRLTIAQLADVFTGRVSNWKQLGGEDRPIVLLSREVNSGTHVYFKEHVLRKNKPGSTEEFSTAALMLPSSQSMADEVEANPNAIGYYGMGYISPRQKALAIAKDSRSPYEQPTIDNVLSGAYPISRPLFFIVNAAGSEETRQFIDFTLSGEGQRIVVETDFVPVSK